MDEQIKQIAERLKGLRDALDLSVEEVAADCNFTVEEYQAIESGECDFSVSVLQRIARKYGITLDELMFGEEPKMKSYFLTRRGTGVAKLIEISLPPIRPIEEARNKEILQIMGYFKEDQDLEVFRNVLTHCEPMRWYPLFADIIARGNSKSKGIDHVLEYYGIDLKDTMAFGDGGNDIPMLGHAGIGVAMGNASDEVKAAADYVTTSVDEDGIMNALKHFGVL